MFYKKINKNNNREMFDFLKNHYTYYTLNSWNGFKSIANNVKIYNLDINGDCYKLLEILELDNYFTINAIINEWEESHKGYKVGFNGRSNGYLVLYDEDNNEHVFDNYQQNFIINAYDYEDFKNLLHDYGYNLKQYKSELVKMVELVQDFDNLCDELTTQCQYLLDNYDIEKKGVK